MERFQIIFKYNDNLSFHTNLSDGRMVKEGIHIEGTVAVKEIQTSFSKMFPYLRISFFKNNRELDTSFAQLPLNEVAKKAHKSEFWIIEKMKVSEIEQLFKSQMGIDVHVFRRLGNSWIETSYTSDWTLERQNQRGRELYEKW